MKTIGKRKSVVITNRQMVSISNSRFTSVNSRLISYRLPNKRKIIRINIKTHRTLNIRFSKLHAPPKPNPPKGMLPLLITSFSPGAATELVPAALLVSGLMLSSAGFTGVLEDTVLPCGFCDETAKGALAGDEDTLEGTVELGTVLLGVGGTAETGVDVGTLSHLASSNK